VSEIRIPSGPEAVLVRYGELTLKGGNRLDFENVLLRNVRHALEGVATVRFEREHARLFVFPEGRVEAVAQRLARVFGISSVSPAWGVPNDVDAIVACARRVLDDALLEVPPGQTRRFRVLTRRSDKRFPLLSTELDRHVATAILRDDDPLVVDLDAPELVLGLEVRAERTWLFARRYPGAGGLPVGTLGRALCLISGGIDSPVAAWMTMKRGCEVSFVTFHSAPYIGEGARRKVIELVRTLGRWQRTARLYVVPFAPVQEALRDAGAESYRTVLYRRMMQRIATRIAAFERAGALVTGECLGQVASQTLENLTCIGAAAGLPVLRPLIGFDKQETIDRARTIGTLELSSVQEPDCCTLFLPRHPVLHGSIATCEEIERRIDVDVLVESALATTERIVLEPQGSDAPPAEATAP
jgi:thiamine biosynthesis protein ThiI